MTETSQSTEAVVEAPEVRAERIRRQKVIAVARRFLTHIGALSRQLQIHDPGNQAVIKLLNEVSRDCFELHRTAPTIAVVFAEGHTFVNGVWVRTTARAWESAVWLSRTLERRNARGFRIEAGVGAPEMLRFTQLMRATATAKEVEEQEGTAIGVDGVTLILRPDTLGEDSGRREKFRMEAVELLEEGLFAVDRDRAAKLDIFLRRRQRALAIRLVQIAEETPEDLLVLTAVRDATTGDIAHNLMVAILSIALGRLMDLRRRDLVRLGVCALSHNIGETLLPPELFELERDHTEAELVAVRQHPLMGMAHLLEHFGFDVPIVERALASAEHHVHPGGGGYPEIGHDSPHLFSRIIAVADVYNTLVAEGGARGSLPPDQAMKLVNRKSTSQLDPLLVRLFTRLVGRYPPGSLVELDTGEYGLVVGPGQGLHPLTRPRVLLLTDADGYELDKPILVDLGDRHPRRRAWKRTIMRTRDPSRLAVPVSRYLMADRVEPPPDKMDVDDPSLARRSHDEVDASTRRRFAVAGNTAPPEDLVRFGLGESRSTIPGRGRSGADE